MNLVELKSKNKVIAQIGRLKSIKDYKEDILANFSFDWSKEESNEIFRLVTLPYNKTIGLMSISNLSQEYRLHVNLIESSIKNRGKNKQIKNIPHCLLAFACKQAFAFGYDGFVSLYPKTELVKYYKQEYGFIEIGRYLAIYGEISIELINKFLDED